MRKILAVICSFIIVFAFCSALAFHAQAEQVEDLITVNMKVSPDNLVIHSIGAGDWLTVHVDISYSLVALDQPLYLLVNEQIIYPVYTKADLRGDLVAKFDLSDIKEIVTPPTETLELSGYTKDGVLFYGLDFIRVK